MGLIETIKQLDTSLFFIINQHHNPFFDKLMYWCSDKYFWIPLYAFFLFLIFKNNTSKKSFLIVLFMIVLVVLTDQISVELFKENFKRYRPCHNLNIKDLIHLVGDGCGGLYGFVSSHATNTAGIATFLFLVFRKKFPKYSWLVFIWAALNSYSRVYVGVHYPADVLVGSLLGMAIGFFTFYLFKKVDEINFSNSEKNIVKY